MATITSKSSIGCADRARCPLWPSAIKSLLHQRHLLNRAHSSSSSPTTGKHLPDREKSKHHVSAGSASSWHLVASNDRGIVVRSLNTAVGSATAECLTVCTTLVKQLWTTRTLRAWPRALVAISVLPALILAVQPLLVSTSHVATLIQWQVRQAFLFAQIYASGLHIKAGHQAEGGITCNSH